MNTFREEDVVAFADGKPRTLRLWDTDVTVEYLHVIDTDGGMVTTALYDSRYEFPASELVKIGEMYDTEIRADGKEYFKWIINDEDL